MYLIYGKSIVGKAVERLCKIKNIPCVLCDDSDEIFDFSEFEAIIPSPWIPSSHRIYKTGKVVSELDFAYQFLPKNFQIFSVTGTDWKSTTAWILYSILQKYFFDKKKVFLSGNFEIPFSATVAEILEKEQEEWIIVLEVSSFMSYFIGKSKISPFFSDYTIFTNFKTDHLNWHTDLREYFDAKMNLVEHTKNKIIFNDSISAFAQEKGLKIKNQFHFLTFWESNDHNFVQNGEIFIKQNRVALLWDTHFSWLHNAFNILSVLLVLMEANLYWEKILEILKDIHGLPHRLEDLWKYGKVRVVEDSKSTSAQSLEAALWSYGDEKNLLLIVGGSDKGDDFDFLWKLFHKRVKSLACIGQTKKKFSKIAQEWNIEFIETDDLNEAVKKLYNNANEWDILMLSPGCASFGLFQDYLDRAKKFRSSLDFIIPKDNQ